jgi:hypothetical protein
MQNRKSRPSYTPELARGLNEGWVTPWDCISAVQLQCGWQPHWHL